MGWREFRLCCMAEPYFTLKEAFTLMLAKRNECGDRVGPILEAEPEVTAEVLKWILDAQGVQVACQKHKWIGHLVLLALVTGLGLGMILAESANKPKNKPKKGKKTK